MARSPDWHRRSREEVCDRTLCRDARGERGCGIAALRRVDVAGGRLLLHHMAHGDAMSWTDIGDLLLKVGIEPFIIVVLLYNPSEAR